jgi:hypothetical protein
MRREWEAETASHEQFFHFSSDTALIVKDCMLELTYYLNVYSWF